MHPGAITQETQTVLLLCGRFSPKEAASPLEPREYNRLADWLRQNDRRLTDLLGDASSLVDWPTVGLDRDRVLGLLDRGAAMALAVDKWTAAGLWILSRADDAYPRRLRSHLGRSAPALLFGVGDQTALDRGGLSIVGARDVDGDGAAATVEIAKRCAAEGIAVVSGGARGVDQLAMLTCLDEGGRAVGVLAEGLGKESLAAKYREGIREERLVLVSPYAPHAPFSVGNAMARNKLVYALGDAALVISASLRSGGTWAGAEEELKREKARPVFVLDDDVVRDGNRALVGLGAKSFPRTLTSLRELIEAGVAVEAPAAPPATKIADAPAAFVEESVLVEATASMSTAASVYEAVMPLILEALSSPRSQAELAELLEVQSGQLKLWLDRAVNEGKVEKYGRPPKFSRADPNAKQVSLFGN